MRPRKIVAVILLVLASVLPTTGAARAEAAPLCADEPADFVGRYEGTAAYGAEGTEPFVQPLAFDIALLDSGELWVTVTDYFGPDPDFLNVQESRFNYTGSLGGWSYVSYSADSANVACDASGSMAQFSGGVWGIWGEVYPIPGTYSVSRV